MTNERTSPTPQFKVGDHIWNRTFPFVVGTVTDIGTVGRWDAYLVSRRDNGKSDFIFVDEARQAA